MTSQILVRGIPIGGGAPVTVQSMTNTDTRDVLATVGQIRALTEAGCEIVRLSVYDHKCVQALPAILQETRIPVVADIHFDYRLAIGAMENGVDKLRMNPGNIGGKERVAAVAACAKAHRVPIRIGVNGGSLEKELLHKYGRPSPDAMVESALSHVKLLEESGFYEIVLSLKASNVRDTVEAYQKMSKLVSYPLHIGITEAGFGEDGVIKSAVGLGTLLLLGIGDTLRVSLTGDPVQEVAAAKQILKAAGLRKEGAEIISCPTCGRCQVDLASIASDVKDRLKELKKPITIALMGCAVNGPGEAREADIGIAFGSGNGVLFKKGEKFASGEVSKMLSLLLEEANSMA